MRDVFSGELTDAISMRNMGPWPCGNTSDHGQRPVLELFLKLLPDTCVVLAGKTGVFAAPSLLREP